MSARHFAQPFKKKTFTPFFLIIAGLETKGNSKLKIRTY